MEDLWTKDELGVYLRYLKLINTTYDCIWIDLDEDDRWKALNDIFEQMVLINKSVKIYINCEYIKTIRFSLVNFVEQEFKHKLVSWIPANFETRKDMVDFVDNQIKKELELN